MMTDEHLLCMILLKFVSERLPIGVFIAGASYFDMRNCHVSSSSLWKLLGRQTLPTFPNAFHF